MNLLFSISGSKTSNTSSGSIFIDMDANKKKVEKLLSDKREIEIEIDNIQSECNHKTKVLRQLRKESGFELRWVCDDCSRPLGWPTEQEREEYFK
jgi:hypothetical protein